MIVDPTQKPEDILLTNNLSNQDFFKSWFLDNEQGVNQLTRHLVIEYHRKHLEEFEFIKIELNALQGISSGLSQKLNEFLNTTFSELLTHMQKEEEVLFPYIEIMDRNLKKGLPRNPRFSIKNLLLDFEKEHNDSTFVIEEMKVLIEELESEIKEESKLVVALKEFIGRLQLHILIEDHVLHPHAIKIESDFS